MLGLSASVPERVAEQIAELLGVPGSGHHRARTAFHEAGTLKGRGQILVGVLSNLEVHADLGPRLLAAGHLASLWGSPRVWLPDIGRSVCVLSRVGLALLGPAG